MDITSTIISTIGTFFSNRVNNSDLEKIRFELNRNLENYRISNEVKLLHQKDKYQLITGTMSNVYSAKKVAQIAVENDSRILEDNFYKELDELWMPLRTELSNFYKNHYLLYENLGIRNQIHRINASIYSPGFTHIYELAEMDEEFLKKINKLRYDTLTESEIMLREIFKTELSRMLK